MEEKSQRGEENLLPSQKVIKGMTYRKLKPEVKMTLEKVVYQLELVAKTLQLMEQRVIDSEDKLQTIMTHIKNNDLDFVSNFLPLTIFQEPKIVNQVLQMNKYNESGSPAKRFGNPLPGDPSIMYTI